MPNTSPTVEDVLKIPERTQVFEDSRTRAKTVAIPFQFPDGTPGVVMVSKLQRIGWRPGAEIDSVVIRYKVNA